MIGLCEEGFPIREIYPWSVAVTDLAEASEVAGQPEVAAHVLVVARPDSAGIAVSGPCLNRPFDQALAQAALAVGDNEAAVSYASRAVAASRQRQTPLFLVRELVFLAEARRRGGDADRDDSPARSRGTDRRRRCRCRGRGRRCGALRLAELSEAGPCAAAAAALMAGSSGP